jgi:hypothetical protein
VCIAHLTTAVQAVDEILSTGVLARGLKSWFGLGELVSDQVGLGFRRAMGS